jgi:hypothetical protein
MTVRPEYLPRVPYLFIFRNDYIPMSPTHYQKEMVLSRESVQGPGHIPTYGQKMPGMMDCHENLGRLLEETRISADCY